MSDRSRESSGTLSAATVLRLLGAGLPAHSNPRLDALLERLGRADGEEWFVECVAEAASLLGRAPDELLAGRVSPAELKAMKAGARERLLATRGEACAAPALTYFLSIALALAHHDLCLTGAPRAHVDASFEQLADVLPEVWAELVLRAAGRPSAESE